ncbi:MAG: hypothetical protein QOI41_1646 [Myxococcales bacterium]|nr:hypothetical protein [Myxococcales bacterium]
MRLCKLASAVVVPVVCLFTLAPSIANAGAPSAGGKRVSKRNALAPVVLPAPSASPLSALPPLPPVARDVTAIMTATSIADASNGGAVAGAPVTLTSAGPETLAPLPAGEPRASAPPVREVVTAESNFIPEVKPTGFVMQLGTGGLVPTSAFVKGVPTLGPGISLDLRVGYYATPHFGILVGFRGSYGHEISGCGDSCPGGYSLQAPVMLQFISKDRTRGVYVEVGVGLGTTYAGTVGSGSYSLSSPIEMKAGLGYRFPGPGGAGRSATVDLNFGADGGSITSAEVHTKEGTTSAKVDGPTHAVIAMSAIVHFSL